MSSITTYSIDKATRFLIKEVEYDADTVWTEKTVIEDLGGNHDLTRIYINLAVQIWKPEEIGFSDLIEKGKNKGFTAWEFFLKQHVEGTYQPKTTCDIIDDEGNIVASNKTKEGK